MIAGAEAPHRIGFGARPCRIGARENIGDGLAMERYARNSSLMIELGSFGHIIRSGTFSRFQGHKPSAWNLIPTMSTSDAKCGSQRDERPHNIR
jgi:hypothetical protein